MVAKWWLLHKHWVLKVGEASIELGARSTRYYLDKLQSSSGSRNA